MLGGLPAKASSPSSSLLNRQSSLNPTDRFKVSYDKDWLKASFFANLSADRLRYSASPEQNTTIWNNDFGIEAEATWGHFVFDTNIIERASRGYAAQSMNRNRLLWGGSVTWKLLKNKARLCLEFEDILNNEDGYWSQLTAYQRTTSWGDFRHHYAGLSFTYHLDAKAKE